MAKKKSKSKKKTTRTKGGGGRAAQKAPDTKGKHLVIVESPTKAKTINKYLGKDYVVMASVGHVRDLPSRAPKGVKQEVPGVDLEKDFEPTYEVLKDKKKTVTELRKAAKGADDVWFATDLDREGEAIAWHLAEALGVDNKTAKRVVFNAITKNEISRAFDHPRPLDMDRVNAQQARRILDRIVGYQVSPFLWKKVAGGLSAGRVQSVATRLVVEREREIDAFVPDEYWKVTGTFATDLDKTGKLAGQWRTFISETPEDKPRTVKDKLEWLSTHECIQAELVEYAGDAFKPDNRDVALKAAAALGFDLTDRIEKEDEDGKGPARHLITVSGDIKDAPDFAIRSIETKRTRSKPNAPFITSTLQQAAANRLYFPLEKTMRVAQQLYEGIDIHGAEGQTGLITYMRTDSTHLSPEAINMARGYIAEEWGDKYLPDKPQVYTSSNKSAQEAHEAIRPTDVRITPKRVRSDLTDDQYKLYKMIWERFMGCQMTPAEWDSTTILIDASRSAAGESIGTFKATGRKLVFEGHYRAVGVPQGNDLILPELAEKQPLGPMQLDPTQHFTSPPPRYTEASLQKKLEEEGIGRPSTYAAIISTIQYRKYVEPLLPRDRRLRATDLGMVVTDMLVEAFPRIMDVSYTRTMEGELDKIEESHQDWVNTLREFYERFKKNLDSAHQNMTHAKAATEPAPHTCPDCNAETVYRFGKNGRFLSCSRYPDCKYAAPIDRKGNPIGTEYTDVKCPQCAGRMTKRRGRFGPFLGCEHYPECSGIVKLDPKKGTVVLPKPPPLVTEVECPKCDDGKMNLRRSKRGPWMSCNNFPKCRGRVGWNSVEEKQQAELEKALIQHEKDNPTPTLYNQQGQVVDEGYEPRILSEEEVEQTQPRKSDAA